MTAKQVEALWATLLLVVVLSIAAVIGICVKCNRDVKVTALEHGLVWEGATYEDKGSASVDGKWVRTNPQASP